MVLMTVKNFDRKASVKKPHSALTLLVLWGLKLSNFDEKRAFKPSLPDVMDKYYAMIRGKKYGDKKHDLFIILDEMDSDVDERTMLPWVTKKWVHSRW